MPRARLSVALPADSPLGSVSREHPSARFRVRSGLPAVADGDDSASGTLLLEIEAPELPSVVAALTEAAGVRSLDVLTRERDTAVCRLVVADAGPLRSAATAGAPPTFPFTVSDGAVEWEVVAPRSTLSALSERLEADGYPFEVRSVMPSVEPTDPLSPRQRAVLRLALERGYYETPQGCTLADIAEEIGLAKSTCSETLRRAERTALSLYLDHETERGDS